MFAVLAKNTIRRSKTRQRVSLWVTAWLCLSQFPIPIVHAHDADAGHDLRLASHIARKHSQGVNQADQLHWHLMMPWEMGGGTEPGGGDEPDGGEHHPSPIGFWGVRVDRLPQGQTSVHPSMPPVDRYVVERINRKPPARDWRSYAAPPPNFLQTYSGVSVNLLICVSLR